ncbi:SMP-30/gluconolactonase/LRE family protein [Corynebacterium resistens]
MKTQLRPEKHNVSLRHEKGPERIDLAREGRLISLPARGPEDVIAFGEGEVLTGANDGSIFRTNIATGQTVTVANTGGRPLGLELLRDGSLTICDSFKGLLRLPLDSNGDTAGDLEVLAAEVAGQPLKFCSNATEAPDGTIWFTESTSRFHYPEFMGAILEHSARGSLNKWVPGEGVSRVLDGLYFANGLVMEPEGAGILFAETLDYCLRRFDIATGKVSDVVTNMPGFPDNMSALDTSVGDGQGAWVAFAHPRSLPLDLLAKAPRAVSHIVWNMPDGIRPGPAHEVWVTRWNLQNSVWRAGGQVRGQHPDFHTPTAAVPVGEELVLASKDCSDLLVLPLSLVS